MCNDVLKTWKSHSLNKPTNHNLSWSNLLDLGTPLTMLFNLWNNYSKEYIWKMLICILITPIRAFYV